MDANGPTWAILSDSNDMDAYDRMCAEAAELGATFVKCSNQSGPTDSQWTDPKDTYCRYFVNSPSVFKFTEAGVVEGVYTKEHVGANAELLVKKSAILEKHGLKGMWTGLEPMWLLESFFEKNPELRGPRVDHPDRSLHDRFAPCIDHPAILEAYRLAVQKICEMAPAIGAFEFYTNDAGAGVCWCEFLYPGQNGPEGCKSEPMGKRVANFLGAFMDGGKQAGRDLTVLMRPKHFSPAERTGFLNAIPDGTGMNYRIFPPQHHNPFMLDYCLLPEWVETLTKRKRHLFVQFPGQGQGQGPRQALACPFLLLETLAEYTKTGVTGMTLLGGLSAHWCNKAILKKHPGGLDSEAERFRAVTAIAQEKHGDAADEVVGFWRDLDTAIRTWPCYNNGLLFGISLVERRGLFMPLMERREDVPVGPGVPWHEGQVHLGDDKYRTRLGWDGNEKRLKPPRGGDLEQDFRLAIGYLDRGCQRIREKLGASMDAELAAEVDRAEVFRCLLHTLMKRIHMELLWERLASDAADVPEAGEALAHARRTVLQLMREELANTKRLIELLEKHPKMLSWARLEEAESSTGGSVVDKLKWKVDTMEKGLKDGGGE